MRIIKDKVKSKAFWTTEEASNMRRVYQDYTVTRIINEENSFLSTTCNGERKERLGKIYSSNDYYWHFLYS